MRFLDLLKLKLLGFKQTTSTYLNLSWDKVIDKTWLARDYAENGYAKNAAVYYCVNQKAKAFSSIPWKLYKTQYNGKKVELPASHPLLLLWNRPNPITPGAIFRENYYGFYCLDGNTWVEITPGTSGIRALYNRSTLEMSLEVSRLFDIPLRYLRKIEGFEVVKFEVDMVTGDSLIHHFKNFNPLNPYVGISPLSAAAKAVLAINEAATWNANLMKNSGRPEALITMKSSDYNLGGSMHENQRKQIMDIMEEQSGSSNAYKVRVVPGDLIYTQLGLTPLEMDYINSKNTSIRDICNVEGVPPFLMGLPDNNSTFNNMAEARLYLMENTIIPDLENFKEKANQDFSSYYGDNLVLTPDYDAVEMLANKRIEKYKAFESISYFSINEKRKKTGEEEIPGGDEPLVSSMLIPLSQLGADSTSVEDQTDEEDDPSKEESSKNLLEAKAVGLSGPLARKNYANSVVIRRIAHERRFKFHLKKHLSWELEYVLKKIEKADHLEVVGIIDRALKETTTNLSAILKKNYALILDDFGADVLNSFKGDPIFLEKKGVQELFNSWADKWIKEQLPKRLSFIMNSTEKRLNSIIEESIKENLSEDETIDAQKLASDIREKYLGPGGSELITSRRAQTIARTETGIAATQGSLGAASEMSVILSEPLMKVWNNVQRVGMREQHDLMDGKEREVEEDFILPDGTKMDGPHDPNADPSQIIGCICVLTYRRR